MGLSDLAGLRAGTTVYRVVYTALLCADEFPLWLWRTHKVTDEAVLLRLVLFFPVCAASDRKTAKNHWLSQLGTKTPPRMSLHPKKSRRRGVSCLW